MTATLPDVPDPGAGTTGSARADGKLETWDAEFLATVHSATGVARRVGAAPWWMRLGWGSGVALLLLLASGIVDRWKSRVPARTGGAGRSIDPGAAHAALQTYGCPRALTPSPGAVCTGVSRRR